VSREDDGYREIASVTLPQLSACAGLGLLIGVALIAAAVRSDWALAVAVFVGAWGAGIAAGGLVGLALAWSLWRHP
jgi:hypothetical protein